MWICISIMEAVYLSHVIYNTWIDWVEFLQGALPFITFFAVHPWIELTPFVDLYNDLHSTTEYSKRMVLAFHSTTKTGSIMILTSLSWIHGWVKSQKGLSQHATQLELSFCGEVQLIVTEGQSYSIYKNDVGKLDIPLCFPYNISVIPLSWCKTNLKVTSAI